ncbi:GH14010 [Drosophila grimshawi]|uniref:GH14010 n=1 Tax=Drosophila grimshawi TaxID=7222 RepID=B4JTK9_DROGR|nr:GH14010 [Drosophila grimshawi]
MADSGWRMANVDWQLKLKPSAAPLAVVLLHPSFQWQRPVCVQVRPLPVLSDSMLGKFVILPNVERCELQYDDIDYEADW